MTDTQTEKAIKRLPLFYIIVIIFAIGLSFSLYDEFTKIQWDLPNTSTLVLEGAVAIIISWTVYIYSKKWKEDNEKVVREQLEKSKKRHDFAMDLIRNKISFVSDVSPTRKDLELLLTKYESFEHIPEVELNNISFDNLPYAIDELKNVENLVGFYSDDLDADDIRLITRVSQYGLALSSVLEDQDRTQVLPNFLKRFEERCEIFFKKYPKLDWNEAQEEILD